MSVVYRAVKSNTSSEVIAIGYDENQTGDAANYHDTGLWQSFTFTEIPTVLAEVQVWADANSYMGSLLKIVDGTVVSKELSDLT